MQLLRLAIEQRRGGAPVGRGLQREAIVQAVVDHPESDGTFRTREAIAELLGYSAERVKQVQGPRGWAGILADARRLVEG